MNIRSRFTSVLVAIATASSAWAFGPVLPSPVLPANAGGGKGLALVLPNGCAEVQVDANLLAMLPAQGEFTLVGFPLTNGRTVDLELERFDPFARDVTIRVGQDGPDGTWVQEPGDWRPTVQCFRGGIQGQPRSMVFLSFDPSTTEGFVIDGSDEVYALSDGGPDGHGPLVVTGMSEVPEGIFKWAKFACESVPQGAQHDEGAMPPDAGMPRAGCKRLEVALDSDKPFVAAFATKTDAMNYLAKMMGAMSTVYYKELDLDAQASFVRIWAGNSSGYPYGTGYNTGTYLVDIYKRWTTNAADIAQNRDIVALMSGQDLGGGRAYGIGGVCAKVVADPNSQPSAYCVFGSLNRTFPYPLQNQNNSNWDPFVFLHEVGHVLGGVHTHDTGDDDCYKPDYSGPGACTMRRQGTIMSYCHQCAGGYSNINFRFTDRNKAQIASAIGATTCVTDCPALNVPTGLVAACEDGKVRLNWDAMLAANGFVIYRYGPTDIVPKRFTVVGGATTTYLDGTVLGSTTYMYQIRGLFPVNSTPNTATSDYEGPVSDDVYVSTAPATPTGLAATFDSGTLEVQLSWTSVSGAASYEIWRGLGSDPMALLDTSATNAYTDTLPPDRLAHYQVLAVEAGGCKSTLSDEVLTGVGVTDLVSSDGGQADGVQLSWTAVPGALGYRIYRADGQSGVPADLGLVTASNDFLDDTADVGQFYNYAIITMLGSGDSDMGNQDDGWRNAAAPTNLAATDCTSTEKVTVTWDASVGATKYDLYRAIGTGVPVSYKTGLLATSYDDVEAYPDTPYTYAVYARTAAGDASTPIVTSEPSDTDEGCRSIGPPTGVVASDGGSISRVIISFTRVPGVGRYRVYRAVGGGAASPLAYTDRTPFEDTTAEPAVLYTYSLTSVTSLGETVPSASDTGWRNIGSSSRVTASDGVFTDRVVLSWQPVSGAVSYQVWRSEANGAAAVLLGSPAGVTTFTDMTPVAGTLYTYSIFPESALGRALVGTSDVGWSNILPPDGVTASNGTSNVLVLVQWNAAANATGYAVFRRDPSMAGGPVRIGATRAAIRNFSDRTARPGKLYYYTVRSTVSQGESVSSTADAGWRNNPSGPNPVLGGGGEAGMGVTDRGGSAGSTAGLMLSGPANTAPADHHGDESAPLPADADPVLAPIAGSDPAWALDCENASADQMRAAVAAGSRDADGDGQPDLCQRERGDLDLSGRVDGGDLALLLTLLGNPDPVVGDLDHDGQVGREDLRILLDRVAEERMPDDPEPDTAR